MREHSLAVPGLSENERERGGGSWRRKARTDLVEHEHEPNRLSSASRPRISSSTSRVVRVKHEHYGGGLVDDVVQRADVEPLQLLLRLAAPDKCLLRGSGWDVVHGSGSR